MSGRIPRSFIDDLLARTDIVDVIDAVVPLRKAGKNHQARCPFHEEKTPSFTVSQQKQFFHCFGCGANGSAIGFLMDYHKIGFVEAIEELASKAGLEVPREGGAAPVDSGAAGLHEINESVADFYRTQLKENRHGKRAVEYLKGRGVTGEVAARFELGYAPPGWDNVLSAFGKSETDKDGLLRAGLIIRRDGGGFYDRFRDRLMFPIRDQRGRAIGFGGRVMDDEGTPKYLNSPETPVFHKGRELYGLHLARSAGADSLNIVEGYMDVVALAQFDVRNVAATLGTAATREHMEVVFRGTSKLIFCFDGDEAGRRAAWRALETALPFLRDGRQVFFRFMPEGEDPDTFVRKHGRQKFEDSAGLVPLSDHLLNTLREGASLTTREGRAKLLDDAIPYLKLLPAGALRELLLQDLSQAVKMPVDYARERLEDRGARPAGKQARPAPPSAAGRTLLGGVIRLLIGHPTLAALVSEPSKLRHEGIAGSEFLVELLEFIHSRPDVSSAGIIEHWRDSRYEERLRSLAAAAEELDSEDLDAEAEFLAALERLEADVERLRDKEHTRVGRPAELSREGRAVVKNLRKSDEGEGKI